METIGRQLANTLPSKSIQLPPLERTHQEPRKSLKLLKKENLSKLAAKLQRQRADALFNKGQSEFHQSSPKKISDYIVWTPHSSS